MPDDEAAGRLAGIAAGIAAGCGGRAVPAPDLHLTLAFIGAWPLADEARLIDAMTRAADAGDPSPRARFELARLGSFGRGLVWIAPATEPPWLRAEAARLRASLAERRITFDVKPFRPHMTLVRGARDESWRTRAVTAQPVAGWTVALGRSVPSAGKPRYRWHRHRDVIPRS